MPSETNNQDGYATENNGTYRWQDASETNNQVVYATEYPYSILWT